MTPLTHIPFAFDVDALMSQAHVETGSDDAADFGELIRVATESGRPKAAFAVSFVTERKPDAVQLDGVWFESRALARNLAHAERVFAVIATCGREMDDGFPAKGDILQEYWWDLIKMSLLRAAHAFLADHLRRKFRLGKTAAMNPGSGDAHVWPIEQQASLFRLFPDHEALLGVRLTDSFLMVPNKTTSGIIFPVERDFRTCEVCHRENCPGRQAGFSPQVWDALQHE
jgi:hypothetical protein